MQTVFLTGTTDPLASYLLAALDSMHSSEVSKIYSLNRLPNSKNRQRKSNIARGLNLDWDNGCVEFLHADLSKLGLGLEAKKCAELLNNTIVVIHNA